MNPAPYLDRSDAGRQLARLLRHHAGRDGVVVLALPRGGLPVAAEIVRELDLPLDVFVVRKLGAPDFEELAFGAIARGGVRVLNEDVIRQLELPVAEIERISRHERQELETREARYRGGRPPLDVVGKTVILVDDGLATGASMRAAIRALRHYHPESITVAVPVGSMEAHAEIHDEVEEFVCGLTPDHFRSVGMWYGNFRQVSEEEVSSLLAQAARARGT